MYHLLLAPSVVDISKPIWKQLSHSLVANSRIDHWILETGHTVTGSLLCTCTSATGKSANARQQQVITSRIQWLIYLVWVWFLINLLMRCIRIQGLSWMRYTFALNHLYGSQEALHSLPPTKKASGSQKSQKNCRRIVWKMLESQRTVGESENCQDCQLLVISLLC
jgi:hypothetical protein